jgi:hypothetical protein
MTIVADCAPRTIDAEARAPRRSGKLITVPIRSTPSP